MTSSATGIAGIGATTAQTMELSPFKTKIRAHFDAMAPSSKKFKLRNAYYHERQKAFFRFLVPKGKRVLELGCGAGELLADLEPSYGLGMDLSPEMVKLAKKNFPHLDFRVGDAETPDSWLDPEQPEPFDFIVMSDLVGHLEDVQEAIVALRPLCTPTTRIIISYYNFLWSPVLKFAELVGLKCPSKLDNWLSPEDLENLLQLADFEVVKKERRTLVPKKIPLLHGLVEIIGSLPGINRLCLSNYVIARTREPTLPTTSLSVSVVVPCKNERGNIEQAVLRTPEMGRSTEIIFVDGHSKDGTPEEIQRCMAAHPERDIKFLVQDGRGKGDAVRKGFAHASGDVLMILDADLTVQPEELPKFYHALASGKGEFINGSRLVYPMEDDAMRFLNMLGNKFFSLVFSWLLNQRIRDTLCGAKVISRGHYASLAANRDYFGDFDPFGDFDLLFGASKLNLRIVEIPIRYKARQYGETQISRFRHGLLLLKMSLFAIRKLKAIP